MFTEADKRMKLLTGNNEAKKQWSNNTFKVLEENTVVYNSTPSETILCKQKRSKKLFRLIKMKGIHPGLTCTLRK